MTPGPPGTHGASHRRISPPASKIKWTSQNLHSFDENFVTPVRKAVSRESL